MKNAAIALFAAILVVAAQAQVQPPVQARLSPWIYDPYVRQFGSPQFSGGVTPHDQVTAVETLSSGAVLVAGATYGSLAEPHAGPSGSGPDIFLARFDPRGVLEWASQIGAVTGPNIPRLNGDPSGPGGDAGGGDWVFDLAVAADESVFVTGHTSRSLGETNAGLGDIILAKFDSSGSLLWLHQLGVESAARLAAQPGATHSGKASRSEQGVSILVHPNGDVYVGGHTDSSLTEQNDSGGPDFLLARYDASGNLQWLRQMSGLSAPIIGFGPLNDDITAAIALHPTGRIVLAGTCHRGQPSMVINRKPIVMTFDDAGHPLDWTIFAEHMELSDLAIHAPSGRIFVAGHLLRTTTSAIFADAVAASFDADLNLEWLRVMDASTTGHLGLLGLDHPEFVSAMRLDPAGDLILAGTTSGSLNEPNAGEVDLYTAKFRGVDGHISWVSQIGQTTAAAIGLDASSREIVTEVALGPAGTISLGGFAYGAFGMPRIGGYDALLLRLDRYGRLR